MAKFCKYCGQPIPEGGVCSCPEAQAEAQAAAEAQSAAEAKIRAQVSAAMKQAPVQQTEQAAPAPEPQAEQPTPAPQVQQAAPAPAPTQQQYTAQPQYDQQQYTAQPQYNQQQYTAQPQYDQQQYNQQQYAQQPNPQQPSSSQQAMANAQQAMASAQQAVSNIASSPMVTQLKDYLIGMFKAPVGTLEKAVHETNRGAQYLMAAVSSVAMILIMVIFGLIMDLGFGGSLGLGIVIVLCTMIPKLLYALCAYPLSKRYCPTATMQASIGGFCMASIYDAVAFLFLMLFSFIGLFEIAMAFIMVWFVVSVLEAVAVTAALTNFNTEAVFRVNLILQTIMMIVLVFAMRSIAVMVVGSAINSMLNMLW